MRTFLIMVLGIVVAFLGCETGDPVQRCEGQQEGRIVESLAVSALPERAKAASDNDVAVPLSITAQVPCLRGGAQVFVSTSTGKVEDQGPGSQATVFLSPVGDGGLGAPLQGETELIAATGRTAHVLVQLNEFSATTNVLVPAVDGGTPDGGE